MKRFLLAAILIAAPVACAGTGDSFLLRGATIHTISGADIPAGAVLVTGGKIVEVGAKIAAPKGVRVIEARGLHVYPGMIDAATQMGLTEIGSVRESNDVAEIGTFNPQIRALAAVNPASEHIPVTRTNGITMALSLPVGGTISGRAALIHLDGWTWEEMEVRGDAAMHLVFPVLESGGGRRGGSGTPPALAERKRALEVKVRELHNFFESARRYHKAKAAGAADLEPDLKLEAMAPVLDGRMPLIVTASREKVIKDAIAFAESEKIKIVLAGASEAWKVAAELKAKDIPVILGRTLSLPEYEDDPYDKPYTQPAELYKAGVKFAIASFTTSAARNLPYEAAMAVAFGLPHEAALKAVTLAPAEILGIANEYGSIEKGKYADLMVTDGDPLETRTQVKQLFIKGKPVDLMNKHRRLYEQYLNRK
ncbi:MAG: amidohydrolase family protein [Acidobacteriales bacterium]|nr:amidohydrolase family protein [Terriglobales bacterium]